LIGKIRITKILDQYNTYFQTNSGVPKTTVHMLKKHPNLSMFLQWGWKSRALGSCSQGSTAEVLHASPAKPLEIRLTTRSWNGRRRFKIYGTDCYTDSRSSMHNILSGKPSQCNLSVSIIPSPCAPNKHVTLRMCILVGQWLHAVSNHD
jgi:hypothetical protein